MPHNLITHSVTYTGTYDNDTIQGWFSTTPAADVEYACNYFGITNRADGHWTMLKALWSIVSELTIVQAQDLLGLGSEKQVKTYMEACEFGLFFLSKFTFLKEKQKKFENVEFFACKKESLVLQ